MRIVGIIQARLGSSRLPLKMLLSLHGKPIIEWVVRRVQKAKLLDEIVVAIPDTPADDVLEVYLKKLKVNVFRGSEADVLSRFYFAAKKYKATEIVRICADNPLIDKVAIDDLIHFYKKEVPDYAYNHIPKNNLYPDGLGAEITSFKNLEEMYHNAKDERYREHCMSYIVDHPEKFKIKTFDPKDKRLHHPELKFDIDTFDDFKYLAMKDFDIDISAVELVKLFTN